MSVKNNIRILQWNIRSISSNIDCLRQFLASNVYHVLLVQSLNINKNKLPKLDSYYYPPVVNQEGDRANCVIYIHAGLRYCDRKSPVPEDIESKGIFSCAVTVQLPDSLKVNFACVYLPKGPNEVNTEWVKAIKNDNEKWIIGGDFNAHSPFWEKDCTHVTSNRLVENIVDSQLCLLNNGSYTRIPDISTHKPTAIDLTLVSPKMALLCTWETYCETLGSDHIPIIITVNKSPDFENSIEDDTIPRYDYKKARWSQFYNTLNGLNINLSQDDDINIMNAIFCTSVLQAADLCIPRLKKKGSKEHKHHGNIWWNEDCEKAVNEKKRLFKDYVHNKNKQDKNTVDEKFKAMKNANIQSNRIIEQAKKEHWENFCKTNASNHKDTSAVWKEIKTLKNGIKLPEYPIVLKNNNFPSSTEKAEAFVDQFAKVSRLDGLSKSQRKTREDKEHSDMINDIPNKNDNEILNNDGMTFINDPITFQELKNAIDSLPNKRTAVGIDAISNEMIKNFPEKWIHFLLIIFEKCWSSGVLPQIWKESVITPIYKEGKSKISIDSYRPISLTSHVCKLFESIVLNRLSYFCEKNNVIPKNQAGFRKGRSTIEHLVKLTTQVKHQFSRRKCLLATFFDVTKAYDQVWHSRLLYKLKDIGLSGNIYDFIKTFLEDRHIRTKVGNSYSTRRKLHMGIPQGSVIAPILFNILMHDLPRKMTKKIELVQYADDICIWMKLTLKRGTPVRSLNYFKKLYQNDLNIFSAYMAENGLQISTEKTHMMLFNTGADPVNIPAFHYDGIPLKYTKVVKFLGVHLTSNMSWNAHIENILTKARKTLNLLKIISNHVWAQDTKTLLHLSTALIRSKLMYAQEVFFSAPKYLLKKIRSIDSKAYKIALGLPIHASCVKAYSAAGVLPLEEYRKLACTKFLIRSSAIENNFGSEMNIRSDINFPKRAKNITSQTTLRTYTSSILDSSDIELTSIAQRNIVSSIPPWNLNRSCFDIEHTDITKNENINLLSSDIKIRLHEYYSEHLKVYTDGSLIDGHAGAAYVIPGLKAEKSYYIGKHKSIFTAELTAIIMALEFLNKYPGDLHKVVLCVDSKSVLTSIKNVKLNIRPEMVFEIVNLVHLLSNRHIEITFFWVPSHCGLYYNEKVDILAKKGAKRHLDSHFLDIFKSIHECYSLIEKEQSSKFQLLEKENGSFGLHKAIITISGILKECDNNIFRRRKVLSLMCRWKLNCFKTRYVQNVYCICGHNISPDHISSCSSMESFLPKRIEQPFLEFEYSAKETYNFFLQLLESPIGKYL